MMVSLRRFREDPSDIREHQTAESNWAMKWFAWLNLSFSLSFSLFLSLSLSQDAVASYEEGKGSPNQALNIFSVESVTRAGRGGGSQVHRGRRAR